ncbi:MAG: radical SAM protein, partial [Nautiliaceae bacterium]
VIVDEAKLAKKYKATGFCLVTSGKSLDDKTLEYVCKVSKAILKEVDITLIGCNGVATKEALKELKKAGVKIYNHNLETGRSFYSKICSTHSFEERFNTCLNVKEVGLKLCSGGIFGLGESKEDIQELINALKELKPNGVPINFFIQNPKLPLKATWDKKMAIDVIKRIKKEIKPEVLMLAGGRELVFGSEWVEALKYGINAIVIGDYLTTKGERGDIDLEILRKHNIKIVNEC